MAGTSLTGPLKHSKKHSGARKFFEGAPIELEPDYVVLKDDFVKFTDTETWSVVKDTSAVGALLADAPGGVLQLAGTASDDTGSSVQTDEVFSVANGQELWFEARVCLTDADQTDAFLGLSDAFITNPEAVLTTADIIGFRLTDGTAAWGTWTEKNGTATGPTNVTTTALVPTDVTAATNPADAAWQTLSFHVHDTGAGDGTGKVDFYIDRNLVATHTANIPDDLALAAAAFSLNGEATANSLYVDYIMVVQERV